MCKASGVFILGESFELSKVLENISWLFIDKVLRMGAGLLVGVWVARYLGPEQFGLLNLATAFVAIFSAIAGLGLPNVVVRELVKCRENSPEILGSAAFLHVVSGATTYIVMLIFFSISGFGDRFLMAISAIVGGGILFKAADVVVYWFESRVQSKYVVFVQNSVFLLCAAIKIALIKLEMPLIYFAWVALLEMLFVALMLLAVMQRKGIPMAKLRISKEKVWELVREGWPLCLSGVAVMLYMRVDQVMLGAFIGNDAVGIFSSAARISEIWYFVPITICASVFPGLIKTKNMNPDLYHARTQRLFDFLVILSIFIAAPMAFFSSDAVSFLFGERYGQASVVLAIHIWASIFVFLGVASTQWLIAEGLQVLAMRRTFLGLFVNIAFNFILIPMYGVIGAAIATVVSQATVAFLSDPFNRETRILFIMKLKALNFIGGVFRLA